MTKPKISADQKTARDSRSAKSPTTTEQAAQPSKTRPGESSQATAQSPGAKSPSDSSTGRPEKDKIDPNRTTSTENAQDQKASGSVGQKTGETAQTFAAADDATDGDPPPASGEPPEKHDHAKYVERVKKKAVEQVSRERPCTEARLCMNPVTEEWSLTLYYQEDKTFFLATYSWDPIDEKWEKSLVSGKRPMAQWDQHVRFSSAGKECESLKSRRR